MAPQDPGCPHRKQQEVHVTYDLNINLAGLLSIANAIKGPAPPRCVDVHDYPKCPALGGARSSGSDVLVKLTFDFGGFINKFEGKEARNALDLMLHCRGAQLSANSTAL